MNRYSVAALLSGCFFGCTGLFTRAQSSMGLTPMGMLFVRCTVAALCFLAQILLTDRSMLRIRLKDLWLFLAVALAGQLFFSFCYYTAISMMSISTACILLYLSPALVMLLARVIFKDKVGKRGIIAVVLCVLGCACVSGFGGSVSPLGLLYGLGSAVAFALINILDRLILNRGYKGTTVNFYLCLFAAIGAACLGNVGETVSIVTSSASHLLICLVTGLVTGFLPYLFFSYALSGCESGKVSILASTEPIVATLISIIIFHEPFGILSAVGIVLVLGSIVLQNTKGREEAEA